MAARQVDRLVRRLQAAVGRSKASSCDRTESERENVRVIRGSWASIGLRAALNVLAYQAVSIQSRILRIGCVQDTDTANLGGLVLQSGSAANYMPKLSTKTCSF